MVAVLTPATVVLIQVTVAIAVLPHVIATVQAAATVPVPVPVHVPEQTSVTASTAHPACFNANTEPSAP